MKKNNILYTILGFVIFFAFTYASYKFFSSKIDIQFKITITSSLIAFFAYIVSNYQIKKREIEERHFSRKAEVYQKFFNIYFDLLTQKKDPLSDQIEIEMFEFKRELLTWGSSKLIEIWIDFENNYMSRNPIISIENLLKAVREDLGHVHSSNYKYGNLVKLLLTQEGRQQADELLTNFDKKNII
ncbi:hypothetical protein [Seleniivibrio woodruffii]|uniref:hypothetical protein n=1 Tax=Seleniivibrio woodruffii TaxID=1078050 RepID=UPI0039E2C95C